MNDDRSLPAVLMREHLTRVVDVSPSGCLLESRRPLKLGTICRLRLRLGDEECSDDIEVVRCERPEGSSVYRIGVRFLWTSPRERGTIREAVTRHLEDGNSPRTVWLM